MSMQELERALEVVRDHEDEAAFVGPRPELLVRTAEKALGKKLPPTYRRFLRKLGAGSFGASETYGVIDADFAKSSPPDAVWATLRAREKNELPEDLLVLGYQDDEITCLRLRRGEEEGPVLIINAGEDPELTGTHEVAPDFGTYFLKRVEEELGT
jgi:antitoxin YobK